MTLQITKKETNMSKELLSKIEQACRLKFKEKEQPQIINGCLRIIEHTNLAYVYSQGKKISNIIFNEFIREREQFNEI